MCSFREKLNFFIDGIVKFSKIIKKRILFISVYWEFLFYDMFFRFVYVIICSYLYVSYYLFIILIFFYI